MSFIRLIPTLTLKDGRIIKTVRFDEYVDIGNPITMGKVFDSQDVDELVFLDISASQEAREPDWNNIQGLAEECAMPLTIGGGISSLEHIRKLLQIGADKISINTIAAQHPDFIRKASEMFGSQCIVVSIDVTQYAGGQYEVLINGGYDKTGLGVIDWARQVEAQGAGEILLTSIDRDGTMEGYDIELINLVADAVSIPVIANGGAGLLYDLIEVVEKTNASAAACSSIFAFTDNKPIKVKSFMQYKGLNVRPI